MRMVFPFDGRIEGVRDGSIVWYFLSRDVDVGITCDEDDSWESWDRTSQLILPDLISIIVNAVTENGLSCLLLSKTFYDTVFTAWPYAITRQEMPPRVDRLAMIRNFHFTQTTHCIFCFLSCTFLRKFEPNLSYYAYHYIAQLSTYNTSNAMIETPRKKNKNARVKRVSQI